MANAVDICNIALSNLGDEANVTSIDPPEGSAQAEKCAAYYQIALRFLLSTRNWSFATRQEKLSLLENSDRNQWLYCYAMPASCVSIIRVANDLFRLNQPDVTGRRGNWETGLNKDSALCIYTNVPDASIVYITDRINPAYFSTAFAIALSWKLSSLLAGSLITGSEGANMANNCEKRMQQYLLEAQKQDAQQSMENLRDAIPQFILHRG